MCVCTYMHVCLQEKEINLKNGYYKVTVIIIFFGLHFFLHDMYLVCVASQIDMEPES